MKARRKQESPTTSPTRAFDTGDKAAPWINRSVLAARVRELELALRPFIVRPDVIKYGALSRGVAREYERHVKNASAIMTSAHPLDCVCADCYAYDALLGVTAAPEEKR